MSINVFILICSAILCLLFLAVFIQVKKRVIIPILKDRGSNLKTPLDAFRESHRYDALIKGASTDTIESISKLFEEMCLLNPLDYEDDDRVPQVLSDYKDLMNGRITDSEGKHIPSEFINGVRNADYSRYLKSQIKILNKQGKDISWFKGELKRFSSIDKAEMLEIDFIIALENMGAPRSMSWSFVNETRMKTFKPDDWKELVAKVKEYSEVYSEDIIVEFLDSVNDIETLLNNNKMEAFCKLVVLGIDGILAAAYVKDDITSEDLQEVCDVKDKYRMDCDEALRYVLERKARALKTRGLNDMYRDKVRG